MGIDSIDLNTRLFNFTELQRSIVAFLRRSNLRSADSETESIKATSYTVVKIDLALIRCSRVSISELNYLDLTDDIHYSLCACEIGSDLMSLLLKLIKLIKSLQGRYVI